MAKVLTVTSKLFTLMAVASCVLGLLALPIEVKADETGNNQQILCGAKENAGSCKLILEADCDTPNCNNHTECKCKWNPDRPAGCGCFPN